MIVRLSRTAFDKLRLSGSCEMTKPTPLVLSLSKHLTRFPRLNP